MVNLSIFSCLKTYVMDRINRSDHLPNSAIVDLTQLGSVALHNNE